MTWLQHGYSKSYIKHMMHRYTNETQITRYQYANTEDSKHLGCGYIVAKTIIKLYMLTFIVCSMNF